MILMRLAARFGRLAAILLAAFVLPALVSTGLWAFADRPGSWRSANWASSGLLSEIGDEPGEAAVHIVSARTGGLKGAISVHSWILLRKAGATHYERYDKVGWGSPIRKNGYPPDGRWYSNDPFIVKSVNGAAAEQLIPRIEAAIAAYPHAERGGYRIWPGPNSNSFVAYVLREVPEIDAVLPPNAVGRDYLAGDRLVSVDADGRDLHLTFYGLAGIAAGLRSGFEVHLFGLVAGIDVMRPAIKVPGIGRIGF